MKNRIKEIRMEKAVTVDNLAEMSGLNRSTIMKAEKQSDLSATRMGLGAFVKIAKALDVSIFELLDAETEISIQTKERIRMEMDCFNLEKGDIVKRVARALNVEVEVR